MDFYFSLKVIEEREKKYFFKKKQMLRQQKIEIKQLKQVATLQYNYSSSQMANFQPLLRISRDQSTLQP